MHLKSKSLRYAVYAAALTIVTFPITVVTDIWVTAQKITGVDPGVIHVILLMVGIAPPVVYLVWLARSRKGCDG